MSFRDIVTELQKKSLLCIGLDTDIAKIPTTKSIFEYNKKIIDLTKEYVCTYKLNIAFYEYLGIDGIKEMLETVSYIKSLKIPVICDAKRCDIANTAEKYAITIFDRYEFDATTVNPYMGYDSIEPFIKYKDKYVFVLCKTSNKGSEDFQDIDIGGKKFYELVAEKVVSWNTNGNCGLVVGATYPEVINKIRTKIPDDMQILIPGIGVQAGDLNLSVKYACNSNNNGAIINISRAIIYTENPHQVAKKYCEEINNYRIHRCEKYL